jgi:predicted deacylase
MFLEFINRKKAKKFNEDLIKAAEGRADLTPIGGEMFKIVINPKAQRTICFVAGLHGDEEAGPYGVLSFLESKFHVPSHKRVILIPLANPSGFEKGTRENADDEDINRNFLEKELKNECKIIWDALKHESIDLLHTLHEDYEAKLFYLYYTHHKQLAEDLREMATQYFNIEDTKNGDDFYGDRIYSGLIPLPHEVTGTIEDKFLIEKAIPYITTESPGMANLNKRIEFNKNAIKMAINSF